MSETTALAVAEKPAVAALMKVSEVKHRLDTIHELMKEVMKPGIDGDYGIIPGTGKKPVLLKPGAEKLCTLFRLAPSYRVVITDLGDGHREVLSTCTLTHIPTQCVWGSAEASCSTMESKYRWRNGERLCPTCAKPAIIKGRAEFGGGWICFAKKGGCGAKFSDGDKAIEGQVVGRVKNPDIADSYNTVLKISNKRALVAAVVVTTGVSGIFTQDMEDESAGAGKAEANRSDYDGDAAMDEIDGASAAPAAPPPATKTNRNKAVQNGSFNDRIASMEAKTYPRNPGTDGKPKEPGTYWIFTTLNNTKLSTFSETIMKQAQSAMAEEATVMLEWEDRGSGYGKTIKAVLVPQTPEVYEGELEDAHVGRG